MKSISGKIVQITLRDQHRFVHSSIKMHSSHSLFNVHKTFVIFLLCLLFTSSIVSSQCPWPRTPHYASLHSDCVCGYSNVRRLSVQCSPVGNFSQLLSLLHSPPVQRLPIDLLYINNVTGLNILRRNTFLRLDIQQIHIANTRIDTIEQGSFAGLENDLLSLTLQSTGLREIPKHEFKNLKSLRSLDLSQNRIHKVDPQTFIDLKQLATLRIAFNSDLQLDKNSFLGLEKSLKNLNLKAIGLKTVPEAIRNLSELAFLDLALNRIENIPAKIFENLDSLTALSLERNPIRTLQHGAFDGLNDSLSSLSLLNNQLFEFPQTALSQLSALRVLDLGFNNIHHLPENAFISNNLLTLLALDGNPLTTILESSFRHLNSTLRGISVGGKSFICDCRIRWLTEWTKRYNLQITSRERNPQFCSRPNHLRSKSFSQIDFDDFVCEQPPTNNHGRPMPPLLQSVLNSHVLNSQHSQPQVHQQQTQQHQQQQQQQQTIRKQPSQMSHASHGQPQQAISHHQQAPTSSKHNQPIQSSFNSHQIHSSHLHNHPHNHPHPHRPKPIIISGNDSSSPIATTSQPSASPTVLSSVTRDPLLEFVREIETIPIVHYEHKPTQAPNPPTTSSMATPVFIPSTPRVSSMNMRTTTPVFHEITRLENPAVTIANRPIRPTIIQSAPKPSTRDKIMQNVSSSSSIVPKVRPKQSSQHHSIHKQQQQQPQQPPKIVIIKNNQPTTIAIKPTVSVNKPVEAARPVTTTGQPPALKLTDVTYRNGTLSLKWQPLQHNRKLLGYQVLYRYFGSKKYHRSHWISAKNTTYSVLERIEPNEMIVVCVAMLEEFGSRISSEDFDTQIPMSQCREVTTVELTTVVPTVVSTEISQVNQSITNGTVLSTSPHSINDESSHDILPSLSTLYPALKRLNEIDKIVIAISALVCVLIVIAIIVFSCCFYRSVSDNSSLHTLNGPYFTTNKSRSADWETVSVYSTRSIPRARILQNQSRREASPPIPPPTITGTIRSQYRSTVQQPPSATTPTNRYFGSRLSARPARSTFMESAQSFCHTENGYHYGFDHSQNHQQNRTESRARSRNKTSTSINDLKLTQNRSTVEMGDSSTSNSSAASSYNPLLPSNSSSNSYNSQHEYDSDTPPAQSIRPPTRSRFQGGTVNSTSTRMNDNELDIYIDQNYVKRFF